jgi:hypothetical protein
MIHAPACAEACFHLHWRWGVLAPYPPADGNPGEMFRGWNDRAPYMADGAPLIPPNQHLRVALAHPDATRADGYRPNTDVVGKGAVVRGTKTLPKIRKALWYTVDVGKPESNRRQVILEQGAGWSFAYHRGDLGEILGQGVAIFVPLAVKQAVHDAMPVAVPDTEMDMLFHVFYSSIRWFYDPVTGLTVEQIPTGPYKPDPQKPALEAL